MRNTSTKSFAKQAVMKACKKKTEKAKPIIGDTSEKKVLTFMTTMKRIITQHVVIFYDVNHNPIWISYENKLLGQVYKEWRDYCAMCKILSIGRNRNAALSYACEVETQKGNRTTITLRQFNKVDEEFGCKLVKVLDLDIEAATDLAIEKGLNDLFGYRRKKERYGDGVKIYHASHDPITLLKTLAKRVHTVVRKNTYGFYVTLMMYGHDFNVYIDTRFYTEASSNRQILA